jgi:hypothetical protein
VAIKTTGYEKLRIAVMLSIPANGRKLTHCYSVRKNITKRNLHRGIIFK